MKYSVHTHMGGNQLISINSGETEIIYVWVSKEESRIGP
jgi:hypothetical protein